MNLFQYQWTSFNGSVMLLNLYRKTKNEADFIARQFGWTPKRWWQWWRFNDYNSGELK